MIYVMHDLLVSSLANKLLLGSGFLPRQSKTQLVTTVLSMEDQALNRKPNGSRGDTMGREDADAGWSESTRE